MQQQSHRFGMRHERRRVPGDSCRGDRAGSPQCALRVRRPDLESRAQGSDLRRVLTAGRSFNEIAMDGALYRMLFIEYFR
jgi:hypothetical protein